MVRRTGRRKNSIPLDPILVYRRHRRIGYSIKLYRGEDSFVQSLEHADTMCSRLWRSEEQAANRANRQKQQTVLCMWPECRHVDDREYRVEVSEIGNYAEVLGKPKVRGQRARAVVGV